MHTQVTIRQCWLSSSYLESQPRMFWISCFDYFLSSSSSPSTLLPPSPFDSNIVYVYFLLSTGSAPPVECEAWFRHSTAVPVPYRHEVRCHHQNNNTSQEENLHHYHHHLFVVKWPIDQSSCGWKCIQRVAMATEKSVKKNHLVPKESKEEVNGCECVTRRDAQIH